jgi:lipoprotein-releasing system permease protein
MNISSFIAHRYLISKNKNTAINIITRIATIGILVGACAMFVLLSVFSGLRTYSLSFSNDFDSDLMVVPKNIKSLTVNNQQLKLLKSDKNILGFSFFIEEKAFFRYGNQNISCYLKGVDSNFIKVFDVDKIVYQGQWIDSQSNMVVPGINIANQLGLGIFNPETPLEVFMPKVGKSINFDQNAYKQSFLVPCGIYFIDNEESNSKYVFSDVGITQELLEYKPNQYTGIDFKIASNSENEVKENLFKIFGNQILVKNRTQRNEALTKMLNTENIALYLILTLIIIITLFTLVGAIIMTIIDKKDQLKTLFAMGAEITQIQKIFIIQSLMICIIGSILGIILGVVIVFLQQQFQLIMISESMAYPVELNFKNAIIVLFTIGFLGFLAALLSSSKVNKRLFEKA